MLWSENRTIAKTDPWGPDQWGPIRWRRTASKALSSRDTVPRSRRSPRFCVSMGQMRCIPQSQIEAMADQDSSVSKEVREHVGDCSDCSQRLRDVCEERKLFRELATAVREDRPSPQRELNERFEFVAERSRGGQGTVFEAVHRSSGSRVALKVIAGGQDASTRERQRFEREVELCRRLNHPSVVPVVDTGVTPHFFYFALEFVEGRSLAEVMKSEELSLSHRLRMFLQICSAVAHFHQRGVLHRDLKPDNVIVNLTGSPRLVDFGLAKPISWDLRSERALTKSGEFLGTVVYAAPEQLDGSGVSDTRTDVYALGVLLYELTTGHLPHGPLRGVGDVVQQVLDKRPRNPRRWAAGLPADLTTVMFRALAKQPERRYQSVDALGADVRRVMQGQPIEARRESVWSLARWWMARHRWLVAAGTLVLAGASLFLSLWLRQQIQMNRQQEVSQRLREVFQEVLLAADPGRMGAGVTLVDLFEDVAAQVDASFHRAPDFQAEIRRTIGQTYARLRRFEEAEEHLSVAVERYREVDPGGESLAIALDAFGQTLVELEDPRAVSVLQEALAGLEAHREEGDVTRILAQRNLGAALLARNQEADSAKAERLIRGALVELQTIRPEPQFEIAKTLQRLSRVARSQLRWKDADALLVDAIARLDSLDLGQNPLSLECLFDRVGVLHQLQQEDQAEAVLEQAVPLAESLFGDERSVDVLRAFAKLHQKRGDLDLSGRVHCQAVAAELERWARRRISEAPRLRALQAELSSASLAGGRTPPFAEAMAQIRDYRGLGSYETAEWMNELAQFLRLCGETAAAESLYQEALVIHCRLYGEQCPIRLTTLEEFGSLCCETRRPGQARELLQTAWAIREQAGSTHEPAAARTKQLLEECGGETP